MKHQLSAISQLLLLMLTAVFQENTTGEAGESKEIWTFGIQAFGRPYEEERLFLRIIRGRAGRRPSRP